MKNLKISAFALITLISFSSCSDDDNATTPVNEEEVITTVTATFTPAAGGTAVVLTSRDLDGDGPDAPVVTVNGTFAAGAVYNGSVTFLNELASPAENITEEIHQEGHEHQLFYQQTNLGVFEYADQDVAGNPVGLHVTYTAAATPVNGTLTITLRHEPNKTAPGVVTGNITSAGGSTDAE
ncbi:MAG: type 1 periplasmic binding fold superfamily protein, partial [Bacteroidota bacterium]